MNIGISIVVPVYNVERHLSRCIDSILNQTFTDFELILVNDGSTDNSGKICDYYKNLDDRVVVIHLKNGGVSKARNIGIKKSRGKYIMFCDSDDYVDRNYCKELYRNIEKNQNSFVLGGYTSVYESANPTFYILYDMKSDKSIVKLKKSEFYILYERILLNSVWNKIYNARLIKKNNIYFNENLNLGEDSLFNLKYLEYSNEDIIVVNRSLYYYIRRSEESLDCRYQKNLFEKYKYLSKCLYDAMILHHTDMNKYENLYWKRYYLKFETIFKNTFHKDNEQSWIEKMNYNNKLCKDKLFEKSINALTEEDVQKLYLKVLKRKNFYLIYFYKILKDFKWNYKYYIKCILIKMKIIKQ